VRVRVRVRVADGHLARVVEHGAHRGGGQLAADERDVTDARLDEQRLG
jgi:hypothetical protein